ncbi:hypothetical protein AOLI_G00232940 [Acnodon oligacanthus]
MSILCFFTRAKEEDRRWTGGGKAKEQRGGALLSGEEARDFYQSLLGEESANRPKEKKEDRKERRRRRGRTQGGGPYRRSSGGSVAPPSGQADAVSERDGHRLLRCAQDGDLRALTELLDRGCDVNFCDGFYWTPLMCASHAGRREAVRLLLNRGAAWVGVVDTQVGYSRKNSDTPDDITPSPRWCDVCQVNYTDGAQAHATSTLHQFNRKHPPTAPHYCLPESSVSYRMMLRLGLGTPTTAWDPRTPAGRTPVGTGAEEGPARPWVRTRAEVKGHPL